MQVQDGTARLDGPAADHPVGRPENPRRAVALHPPRTGAQVAAPLGRDAVGLFRRYRESGDQAARNALVERFLPLAKRLAVRYQRSNEALDDLLQVASLALIKAVDRFDPDRGLAFSSYAVPTIAGELKRYRRDYGWALHVPRTLQDDALKVDAAIEDLAQGGRSPTTGDLAAFLNMPVEDLLSAMEARSAARPRSLDTRSPTEDGEHEAVIDRLGEDDPLYELVDYDVTLAPKLSRLPRRERMILYLRFAEDMTQSEIAGRVGISQMQVSRLIRSTLAQLRESMDEHSADAEPQPAAVSA